ncbi:MAG: hypothetical protein U1D30_10970 [Planctomycetota bacterium]
MLLVDHCWAGRASVQQLQVLDWAIRTPQSRDVFLQFMQGKRAPNQIIVRYDPSLNRAVDFAFAEDLLTIRGDQETLFFQDEEKKGYGQYRLFLARKGRELVAKLKEDEGLFTVEKQFLKSIGRKLTQKQVEILFDWGVAK